LRRAAAIRQCAIIEGHKGEPIQFSPLLFAQRSRRYLEQLVLGSGPIDVVIDSTFQRDSVVQFIAACEGNDFEITESHVFEFEFLCDEWCVSRQSIGDKISKFIEQKGLWLSQWQFRHLRALDTSMREALIGCQLMNFISDSSALRFHLQLLHESSISGVTQRIRRTIADCLYFVLSI
jgi:hypothetical protein